MGRPRARRRQRRRGRHDRYATVYKRVRAILEGPPSALLEHLAGRLCTDLLALDRRLAQVRVRVTKLAPPLKGAAVGTAGVELTRGR